VLATPDNPDLARWRSRTIGLDGRDDDYISSVMMRPDYPKSPPPSGHFWDPKGHWEDKAAVAKRDEEAKVEEEALEATKTQYRQYGILNDRTADDFQFDLFEREEQEEAERRAHDERLRSEEEERARLQFEEAHRRAREVQRLQDEEDSHFEREERARLEQQEEELQRLAAEAEQRHQEEEQEEERRRQTAEQNRRREEEEYAAELNRQREQEEYLAQEARRYMLVLETDPLDDREDIEEARRHGNTNEENCTAMRNIFEKYYDEGKEREEAERAQQLIDDEQAEREREQETEDARLMTAREGEDIRQELVVLRLEFNKVNAKVDCLVQAHDDIRDGQVARHTEMMLLLRKTFATVGHPLSSGAGTAKLRTGIVNLKTTILNQYEAIAIDMAKCSKGQQANFHAQGMMGTLLKENMRDKTKVDILKQEVLRQGVMLEAICGALGIRVPDRTPRYVDREVFIDNDGEPRLKREAPISFDVHKYGKLERVAPPGTKEYNNHIANYNNTYQAMNNVPVADHHQRMVNELNDEANRKKKAASKEAATWGAARSKDTDSNTHGEPWPPPVLEEATEEGARKIPRNPYASRRNNQSARNNKSAWTNAKKNPPKQATDNHEPRNCPGLEKIGGADIQC